MGKRLVQMMVRSLLMKGVLLLGKAGGGKTPFLYTLAFAMSRYQHFLAGITPVVAQVRFASDLAEFKDEIGKQIQPWILDEFDIDEHKPKILKGFFKMQAKDNAVNVRYTFTKRVGGQLVMGADNK